MIDRPRAIAALALSAMALAGGCNLLIGLREREQGGGTGGGAGGSGAAGAGGCGPSLVNCDGKCVDVSSSAHCGACDVACDAGAACLGGTCVAPRYAFVANHDDGTVSAYAVDAVTGQLRHRGYALVGQKPESVTVHPSGKFLYVADRESHDIAIFGIDPSGALVAPSGKQLPSDVYPIAVAIQPSGERAFVLDNASNILPFSVDASSGGFTVPGKAVKTGGNPHGMVIDPQGAYLFTCAYDDGTVRSYRIDGQGELSEAGSLAAFDRTWTLAIDPRGRFLFAASSSTNEIAAMVIDRATGKLGSSGEFAAGAGTIAMAVDPSGRYLYAANHDAGNVWAYGIQQTNGALAKIGSAPIGSPLAVVVDPSGRLVYVNGANEVVTFAIGVDGGLAAAPVPSVRTRQFPQGIAIAGGAKPVRYAPKFAYVTNYGAQTVSAFTVDATSGALVKAGAALPSGVGPRGLAVDAGNRFLYVGNSDGNALSGYSIDAVGKLTALAAPFDSGSQPYALAADPSGRFLYAADAANNGIAAFSIGPQGALTKAAMSNVPAGDAASSMVVDPTGQFAYAGSVGGKYDVWSYAIDRVTGALTPAGVPSAPGGSLLRGAAVAPSGKFLYVGNLGLSPDGGISAFAIDVGNGTLQFIGNVSGDAGSEHVAVHPSGRFVYATHDASKRVNWLEVLPSGKLQPVGGAPTGDQPRYVAVDPSGRFVYVVNKGANDVWLYRVDPTTGALSHDPSDAFPAGSGPIGITLTATIE